MKAQFFIEQNLKISPTPITHDFMYIGRDRILHHLDCEDLNEVMIYVSEMPFNIVVTTTIFKASEENEWHLEPVLETVNIQHTQFKVPHSTRKNEQFVLLRTLHGSKVTRIGDESKFKFIIGRQIGDLDDIELQCLLSTFESKLSIGELVDMAEKEKMLFDFYGSRLV